MGQTSLKYLNRVGYNMYWGGMWDSNNNYSSKFLKFFFLDLFFNKLLKSLSLKEKNYLLNKNINFKKTNSFFFFNSIFFKKQNITNNFNNFFCSKLWILKYQNWVVIVTYLYSPSKVDISLKKGIFNFKKFKKLKKLNKNIINYNFL